MSDYSDPNVLIAELREEISRLRALAAPAAGELLAGTIKAMESAVDYPMHSALRMSLESWIANLKFVAGSEEKS